VKPACFGPVRDAVVVFGEGDVVVDVHPEPGHERLHDFHSGFGFSVVFGMSDPSGKNDRAVILRQRLISGIEIRFVLCKLSSAASDSGPLKKVAGINRNRWPL